GFLSLVDHVIFQFGQPDQPNGACGRAGSAVRWSATSIRGTYAATGALTMLRHAAFALLVPLCVCVGFVPAQDDKKQPAPKETLSETTPSITVNGAKLDYTATAGTLILKEEDGKPLASIFFVAYTKPVKDLSKRPVTFTFNGGPGSSSVW